LRRSLLALVVTDALIGCAAAVATLFYVLLRRDEEAELILLIVLLMICCVNGVIVAVFRRDQGEQLRAQAEINRDLKWITTLLERQTAAPSAERDCGQTARPGDPTEA
jgi:apolipoprotein N-acyltransferase